MTGRNSPTYCFRAAHDYVLYKLRAFQNSRQFWANLKCAIPQIDTLGPILGADYLYRPPANPLKIWTDHSGFAIAQYHGRWYRQPLLHCYLAMRYFHHQLETGDVNARQCFITHARTLLATATRQGESMWLAHEHPVTGYTWNNIPWKSCITQGQGIRVFCRAYQLTDDRIFLDSARRMLLPFLSSVQEDGLLSIDDRGRPFYEEYPVAGHVYHVLNGAMSSMLGVNDLIRIDKYPLAMEVFEKGIAGLSDEVLSLYDAGYTTYYDRRPRQRITPACIYYTPAHVRYLRLLFRITGRERFSGWAERWESYTLSQLCRLKCVLAIARYRLKKSPQYIADFLSVVTCPAVAKRDSRDAGRTVRPVAA